jgi:stress-induced-phosphoprotein 1
VHHYSGAIELDPSNHIYFSNRSAARLSAGDAASALADGEACVRLKPDWPKAHSRTGAALHTLGRLDDAAAAFARGLVLCPGDIALEKGLKTATAAAESARVPALGVASAAASKPVGPSSAAAATEPVDALPAVPAGDAAAAAVEWKEQSER